MQTFSEIVQSSVSLQTQHSMWKAIKTLQETLGVQKQALNNVENGETVYPHGFLGEMTELIRYSPVNCTIPKASPCKCYEMFLKIHWTPSLVGHQ